MESKTKENRIGGKWLSFYAKKHGITPRDYAHGIHVAESTARHHLMGRIPTPDCWPSISKFLGFDVTTNFMCQLKEAGRVRRCLVCKNQILVFRSNVIFKSRNCHLAYDRNRKKAKRLTQRIECSIKYSDVIFETGKNKTSKQDKITRSELNTAIEAYLKTNKITKLKTVAIAEGSDQFSRESFISEGPLVLKMDLSCI